MKPWVDIGCFSMKSAFGTEIHPVVQTMPVGAAMKTQMQTSDEEEQLVGSGFPVRGKDQECAVEVSPGDIPGFTRTMDKYYPRNAEQLALFHAELPRFAAAAIDHLLIGLPFFQNKDEDQHGDLRHRLQDHHCIGQNLIVDVRLVKIDTQPSDGLSSHMNIQHDLSASPRIGANDITLIVDPKRFSIDRVAFCRGFDTTRFSSTSTADESIVQAAAATLSKQYGVAGLVQRLPLAIRSSAATVSVGEQRVAFCGAPQAHAARIGEAKWKAIRGGVRRVDESEIVKVIPRTGGSARLFAPALAAAFPEKRVIVTPASLMANARELYSLATQAARMAAASAVAASRLRSDGYGD